jgi:hypothetical protein
MFKSVKYEGFEKQPELLRSAEGTVPVLLEEIQTWTELVEVIWALEERNRDLRSPVLTLRLDLGNAHGEHSIGFYGGFPPSTTLRVCVREIWGKVLDKILEQQVKRNKAELAAVGG